jgi:hypothetical protein
MRRLATATTADNPRWPRLQRRAAVLSGSNLLLAVAFSTRACYHHFARVPVAAVLAVVVTSGASRVDARSDSHMLFELAGEVRLVEEPAFCGCLRDSVSGR